MKNRIKRIYGNLGDEGLDAIVLRNDLDPHLDMSFFYVTGLTTGLFEGGITIAYPDSSAEVIISVLEEESAKRGTFPISTFKTDEERIELVKEKLKGAKRIGINPPELTHSGFLYLKKNLPDVEFMDVSEAIRKARLVKDEKELEYMKTAGEIASEVAEEIIDFIDVGVKEFEVAAEMSYMMQKKGATGPAFDTIVGFGPNSAEPHYTAGDVVLEKGQFVLLDFGAKYKRYGSDITRTFVMGSASPEQKRIYETVLAAQETALDLMEAGVNGKDVHNAAAEVIEKAGYGGRFTHGLGHTIGLATHDGGGMSPMKDLILEENIVMTVEPGIYIPGFGGVRIEDDVVVKKNHVELLTDARKDFIEL